MRQLLAAEVLKLRTTRTFVALVGSAVALSVLLVSLQAAIDDRFSEEEVRMMFTGDFTPLFIVLLGIMGMAGEWRHRTITSTVLAVPDRLKLLGAKTLGYAVVGALVSVVVTVAIMAIGTAILSSRDETTIGLADLADVLWRNVVIAAYLGALGVCIGALLRNQVAAIVGLLIYMMAAEPALIAVVSDIGIYSPINGVTGAISETDWDDVELLSPGVALALGAGWIATFFGGAAALLKRRDLT